VRSPGLESSAGAPSGPGSGAWHFAGLDALDGDFGAACSRGFGRRRAGGRRLLSLQVYWGVLLLFVEPRWGWLSVAGVALCAVNRLA